MSSSYFEILLERLSLVSIGGDPFKENGRVRFHRSGIFSNSLSSDILEYHLVGFLDTNNKVQDQTMVELLSVSCSKRSHPFLNFHN